MEKMLNRADLWAVLFVLAFIPTICEELAFRGFILSGFRHLGYKWRAIVLTAFLFGLAHGILQQSLNAFFIGLVLGYIAVQSGSIFPCMAFHFTHNALTALGSRLLPALLKSWPEYSSWILVPMEKNVLDYRWEFIVLCGIAGMLLLFWFNRLPYIKTPEERLQDAIARGKQENPEDKDISISLASMIK
jgi:sodium transport system permease protein